MVDYKDPLGMYGKNLCYLDVSLGINVDKDEEETLKNIIVGRAARCSRMVGRAEQLTEDYENRDDIRTLLCGHDFQKRCVKQWLTQRKLCPVCKMDVLAT
uniref:RING-type E3 ubiquitin transferase n=1 Tax=Tanacetum cinerariifolium TaxID=118510 RepID=A0A6L2LU83_TANCI|nr:E3 ubiquitin-protein ligase MBR2 [Tanacetum cinerariifolium]